MNQFTLYTFDKMSKERKESSELKIFKEDFGKYSYDFLTSKWVIERIPHIFNNNSEIYLKTKIQLASLINVDSCSIIFVGSASTGFSLSPGKNFRKFNDKSDIDIAIISHYYFDIAWHTLRNTNIHNVSNETAQSIKEHRNKYIYYGTIATDKIIGLLPFGKEWLNAIQILQRSPLFENRDINFRLYRDHESLREYHINNFKNNLIDTIGVEPQEIKL